MVKLYQRLATLVGARLFCLAFRNVEWFDRHTTEIGRLAKEFLPSGSGFDNGTTVDLDKSHSNRLVLQTSYHHMNDVGMYDGWTEHTVTVNPDLANGFLVTVSGRNRNDIKYDIMNAFDTALDEEVPS